MSSSPPKVAINGYGVIGKRVAAAVSVQKDMVLAGVADTAADWRLRIANQRGYPVYSATHEAGQSMPEAGILVAGTLNDLLDKVDIVVDCTPKHIASNNVAHYRSRGIKFILQGGEAHAQTGHSFVAESNFASTVGRDATRVVSCNTTSIVRSLGALKRAGLLKKARGTLLRRATDPWESHQSGIMNTLVPEPSIPSHQGPDAKTVDSELDVVTMAVKVPQTLAHMHYWNIELRRASTKADVIQALKSSSRIVMVRCGDGLVGLNSVKELMADLKRPSSDLYEVAVWEDLITVQDNELFFTYMVDNQAIIVPETIDAIRALTGIMSDGAASIKATNAALGIAPSLYGH